MCNQIVGQALKTMDLRFEKSLKLRNAQLKAEKGCLRANAPNAADLNFFHLGRFFGYTMQMSRRIGGKNWPHYISST